MLSSYLTAVSAQTYWFLLKALNPIQHVFQSCLDKYLSSCRNLNNATGLNELYGHLLYFINFLTERYLNDLFVSPGKGMSSLNHLDQLSCSRKGWIHLTYPKFLQLIVLHWACCSFFSINLWLIPINSFSYRAFFH